ncbi:hypothetical protein B0H63DRAFT_539112 [Podospora didyma]|uniref:Uncharacterized protein n=1 Tax=Podospora didyma TaxID=330526 RepID=A0AAE0NZU2_9PEZI|nr:hypothetical protein B0H63DRAFT_539112 [Podospora didyma]
MRVASLLCRATALLSAVVQGLALASRNTSVSFRNEAIATRGDRPVVKAPKSGCPPFKKGNFSINAFQLYPENMDWDGNLCQVYIGILFNASFGIYDPYKEALDVVEFPGYTQHREFHVGGVAWDPHSGLASVIVGQGNAFETAGANISGTNLLKKYDPLTRKFLWTVNLTATTQGSYGGFNDAAHDPEGNTYICGTFPSSILKINPQGAKVVPWYLPQATDHTIRGISGIAAHGNTLLGFDSGTGVLYRFDATASTGTAIPVPFTPDQPLTSGDSIRLPIKFKGRVLLIANARGIAVLRSKDASWRTAEFLGVVPNASDLPPGPIIVSSVQIGEKLYIVNDWFADPIVPGTTAGGKTSFPMVEITKQVDDLLLLGLMYLQRVCSFSEL